MHCWTKSTDGFICFFFKSLFVFVAADAVVVVVVVVVIFVFISSHFD